jgi:hypothetical protein
VNKKDLFQICAAAAGALTAESAGVGISSGVAAADKFIPKLDIGRMDAIVKKEINIGSTSKRRGRKMKEADRRRLERSIAPESHRALRMLSGCVDDVLPVGDPSDPFDPSCEVGPDGFACAKLSNIAINATGLKDLVGGVLGKLVVPNFKINGADPGYFDEIGQTLLELDKALPGISDLAGKA